MCSDNNTYLVFRDGNIFVSGINNNWQCTLLEDMKEDMEGCVEDKHLTLSKDEFKMLEEEKRAKENGEELD